MMFSLWRVMMLLVLVALWTVMGLSQSASAHTPTTPPSDPLDPITAALYPGGLPKTAHSYIQVLPWPGQTHISAVLTYGYDVYDPYAYPAIQPLYAQVSIIDTSGRAPRVVASTSIAEHVENIDTIALAIAFPSEQLSKTEHILRVRIERSGGDPTSISATNDLYFHWKGDQLTAILAVLLDYDMSGCAKDSQSTQTLEVLTTSSEGFYDVRLTSESTRTYDGPPEDVTHTKDTKILRWDGTQYQPTDPEPIE